MKKNILLIVLLAVFLVGCKQTYTEKSAHDHGQAKIQYIAYSSEFELFAEADVFVVGEKSNVLSHFSNLPDFSALSEGSVTISLIINGKEINQTREKPSRKGIYSFNIMPETAGKGQLKFDITTSSGNFLVIVPSIRVFSDDHDAIHYAEDAAIHASNPYIFTKEQSWKIDFATSLPEFSPFGRIIKTTAQIKSAQGNENIVPAKTNGIIMFSAEHLLEGKTVSKGQVLFSISGSGLAKNNSAIQYQEALNNYEKAKADFERHKKLANDKIISEKDLLDAKYQYENAKLRYDNLNSNFSSLGQNIVSPMIGFIKQIFVQNGQYVESGQAVLNISQNKTLLLTAEVQQKHASVLGSIHSANIHILHSNKTYSLEELNGKVISFGKRTNIDNYLIPVNLEIDNNSSFISGGFVEVYLKTTTNAVALTIPNSALLEEQGNYFVFVQLTPELFDMREVKPGSTDGLRTEILKGLNSDERIVSKGAILIKLAKATGTLDAHSGHVH